MHVSISVGTVNVTVAANFHGQVECGTSRMWSATVMCVSVLCLLMGLRAPLVASACTHLVVRGA